MSAIKWLYPEPLENQKTLDDFEEKYDVELPEDFRSFISEHNGALPDKGEFDKPRKGMILANLLSFNKDGDETVYTILDNAVINMKLGLVPFGTDGFGNFICLKGEQIVFWNHESEMVESIANSFSDFISMLH